MSKLIEDVKAAALYAKNNPEPDALDFELANLWDDLNDARQRAINGVWSIQCDHIVGRIARLTLHTRRPTEWGDIQVDLLLDGTYEALHEAIGMPTPLSDEDRARAREVLDRRAR